MSSRLTTWLKSRRVHHDELMRIPLFMGVYKQSARHGGTTRTPVRNPWHETIRSRRIELVNEEGEAVFTISATTGGLTLTNTMGGSITISPSQPEQHARGPLQ